MPWCPKCKYEYREGIKVCADCGVELVESLQDEEPEDDREQMELSPEQMLSIAKMASEFELQYDEEDSDEEERNNKTVDLSSGVYVNNEEKANENISSAYTLLGIGGIGIVLVVLFFTGVFPINITKFGKYTISGVMGALFVLFIVMGIVSLRNFKTYRSRAVKENNLSEEIKKWCLENLSRETVDEECGFDDVSEELKYFERTKVVKTKINNQFMNLDDGYVNRLIEEIYPDLFE